MSLQHLFSASIGLVIFIIALIFGKRNKSISDYIFVFWLVIFILNFTSFFLLNTSQNEYGIIELLTFEITEASILIHGPILFFYVLSLTDISFKLEFNQILHFFPFFLAFTILIILIFNDEEYGNLFRNILLVTKMISLFVYTLLSLKKLYSHKGSVKDIFSNTERKYLTWLSLIAWGVLTVWAIAVFSLVLNRFMGFDIPQYGGIYTNISVCFLLFVIGYFGVRQPSLFVEHSIISQSTNEQQTKSEIPKYEKSGLSLQNALIIYQKTVEYMENEKPFLNPELTLYSLALKLQLQPNHLSQAINSVENKNFFDFINHYRTEEVKKNLELKKKMNITLLGLAYECGFNSKASFNRVFKKYTGETPSQYKRRFE